MEASIAGTHVDAYRETQSSMDLCLGLTPNPLHVTSTYVVGLQTLRCGEKNIMFERFSQNGDFRNCNSENFRILYICNFYSKYLAKIDIKCL